MDHDPLREELKHIARRLQPHDIKLIVGGGYGLLLRTAHILITQPVTRFDEPPIFRSTDDLDLFLGLEIITDAGKMQIIRDSLSDLKYKPKAEYFQFEKAIEIGSEKRNIKVDLLAPRPVSEDHLKLVKIGKPRIRPRDVENIHAYLTDEAITIEEQLFTVDLSDNGVERLEVFLPHPFTYMILKLFALRDHLKKVDRSKAAEHAFDIYRIVGMITEAEWKQAVQLSREYANDAKVIEAAEIVSELFLNAEAPGVIEIYRLAGRSEVIKGNVLTVLDDLKYLFLKPRITDIAQ
jgi:hypothetical protein